MGDFKDADIICPFFKRFKHNAIECESVVKGFDTKLQKHNNVQIRSYINKYCSTYEYKKCPYAAYREREDEKK